MRISRKTAIVYLLTLVPLIALVFGVLSQWYGANLLQIERDRINNARLVATAFETFVRDLAGASRAIGGTLLTAPPEEGRTSIRLINMTNSFPLHFSAIVDHDRQVTYSSDSTLLGDVLDDEALDEAERAKGLAMGVSREYQGRVGFMVAQPLYDSGGQHVATAVQFIDPARLARRLNRNPLSGGGASVVDSSGTLVVLFEEPTRGYEQEYWGRAPAIKAALEGSTAIDRDWQFPLDQTRRVVAAVPIGSTGWEASSAIEYDEAMRPFLDSLAVSALIGVLILFISGTGAGLMVRSLLQGVSALREQSMTVGDRDVPPADVVRTGDELEDVSRVLRQTDTELRKYITGLEAISEAGRALSYTIGTGDVESAIVEAGRRIFAATALWVLLYDERTDRLQVATWYSEDGLPAPVDSMRASDSLAGRVFRTGEPIVVPDVTKEPDLWRLHERVSIGIRSLVEIPLERAGRPFGVLGLGAPGVAEWREGGRELALLRTFGNEVTTVLENARLYENERFIADTLQQSLLTIPDRVDGLRAAHCYHAATQTARVGGDFYDLFELVDRSGIVIGDVAGHGLDAAVLTSLVKNAVRAHADEPGKSPASVCELTNELVVKESRPEAFVTLFVGVVDHESEELTYCNAGHTTGAILKADGDIVRLPSTSILVGAFAGAIFEEERVPFTIGDTIVLYTDGLTEARRERELYGEERLFRLLGELTDTSPGTVVQRLFDDVIEYTGGELSDDLAILAVQVG